MKKLEVIFAHERLIEVNNLLHKHRIGGMSFYLIRYTNIKPHRNTKLLAIIGLNILTSEKKITQIDTTNVTLW